MQVVRDLRSPETNVSPDAEPRQKTGLLAIVPSGPLGGATIAAKLNVSTRTIESDTAKLRDEAPEVVQSLRAAGLSPNAIESATGISRRTVNRDLAATGWANAHPGETVGADGRCVK